MADAMKKRLETARVILLALYALTILAYVGAAVSVFFNTTVSLWLVNVTTVLYILVVRAVEKKYNRDYAKANIRLGMENSLQLLTFATKGTLKKEDVMASHLLPARQETGGFVVGKELRGEHGNREVVISEVTTYYPKNVSQGRKVGFLTGLWIELAVPQAVSGFAYVDGGILETGYDPKFYDAWEGRITAGIPQDAVCCCTPVLPDGGRALAKQLNRLTEQLRKRTGAVAIGIRNGKLTVFLPKRSFDMDVPIREPIRRELLTVNPIPELDCLFKNADALAAALGNG